MEATGSSETLVPAYIPTEVQGVTSQRTVLFSYFSSECPPGGREILAARIGNIKTYSLLDVRKSLPS
jgi:hypothetical protein